MNKIPEAETIVIDKWNGRLSRFRDGPMNSGIANYYSSWGYDTFEYNGNLTFSQGTVDITKSVITDLIMAAKVRIENIGGNLTTFVYAIGHLGRLYKIQVNDPVGKNPDYDTPVLLATLANAQTFLYGASLIFAQLSGTERIWIGHDSGVTKINFDGTNETVVGTASSTQWITNVPRQVVSFIGYLFYSNGSNLAQIDTTETVVTYTKISPGFDANVQCRDVKTTPDGRYIVAVVTSNSLSSQISTSPEIGNIAAMSGSLIYWNGTDTAASSSTNFQSFSVATYYSYANYEYVFGYNVGGSTIGTPDKVLFLPEFENAPSPNALGNSGDFMGWMTSLFNPVTGYQQAVIDLYGTIDAETPIGLYRQLIMSSSLTGGDIIRIPFFGAVSLTLESGQTSGYYNASTNVLGEVGSGKSYFSTLEYNGSTTKYGFYSFKNSQDFLSAANTGVYETQHQPFSKKIKATEVRVYSEPVLANGVTSFKIELVGIDSAVIAGTAQIFSPVTTDGDRLKYNPTMAPQSYLGLRITNIGAVSPIIHRVEIDTVKAGN